uniref:acid phosphatase n=1 Tax=Ditylenchus dipsaci TaxID=166011 RepID=A0A915D074_9BILA
MAQHVALGKRLRQKYIIDQKLVSENYKNHEIYVRSTDVNRTLTSAISNFIGFYGESAKAGVDYPAGDWPAKFVPIAVHTFDVHEDHIGHGDASADCQRHKKLKDLWKQTPEYKQL